MKFKGICSTFKTSCINQWFFISITQYIRTLYNVYFYACIAMVPVEMNFLVPVYLDLTL